MSLWKWVGSYNQQPKSPPTGIKLSNFIFAFGPLGPLFGTRTVFPHSPPYVLKEKKVHPQNLKIPNYWNWKLFIHISIWPTQNIGADLRHEPHILQTENPTTPYLESINFNSISPTSFELFERRSCLFSTNSDACNNRLAYIPPFHDSPTPQHFQPPARSFNKNNIYTQVFSHICSARNRVVQMIVQCCWCFRCLSPASCIKYPAFILTDCSRRPLALF